MYDGGAVVQWKFANFITITIYKLSLMKIFINIFFYQIIITKLSDTFFKIFAKE